MAKKSTSALIFGVNPALSKSPLNVIEWLKKFINEQKAEKFLCNLMKVVQLITDIHFI